jgi:hypothetical protein
MIKFVEITEVGSNFLLDEVWINESHVVKIRRSSEFKRLLEEGRLPDDLDQDHAFTSITVNMGGIIESHVVVGDVTTIASKLNYDTKILLKG